MVKANEKETGGDKVVIDFFALLNSATDMINGLLTKGRNADGYDAAKPFFDAADPIVAALNQFRWYANDLAWEAATARRINKLFALRSDLYDAMLAADDIVPISIAVRRNNVDIIDLFDSIAAAASAPQTPAITKAINDIRKALYNATRRGYRDYTKRAGRVVKALAALKALLSMPTGQEQGQEQEAAKPKSKRKPTIKQLTFL